MLLINLVLEIDTKTYFWSRKLVKGSRDPACHVTGISNNPRWQTAC